MNEKTYDPVAVEIYRWLESRPTADDFDSVFATLRETVLFADMESLNPEASESLKKVFKWLFVASQLPLEWLENELRNQTEG